MVDAMQQDGANNTNFERMVVLPATFAGSPRHMNQLYQDSMAFVTTPLWPSVGVKPNTSKVGDLESSRTPECLEFDNKAQNTLH
jgi:hypothetical protein